MYTHIGVLVHAWYYEHALTETHHLHGTKTIDSTESQTDAPSSEFQHKRRVSVCMIFLIVPS